MSRLITRLLLSALLFVSLLLCAPREAEAHMGHEKTRQSLQLSKRDAAPRDGPRGRAESSIQSLTLTPQKDGSFVAGFELRNTGEGPLQVLRVTVRSDEEGALPPEGLGIQTLPKGTPFIAPGQTRLYNVVWRPEQTLAQQAFAQVLIETDSAAPGAAEFDPALRLTLQGDVRPAWRRPLLPLAILLPFLLLIPALLARFWPTVLVDRHLRSIGVVTSLVTLGLSVLLTAGFSRNIGVSDGNDGLQHIFRQGLLGADIFIGLDGLSITLLPIGALLLTAALLAARPGRARSLLLFGGPTVAASALLLSAQTLQLAAAGFVLSALFGCLLLADDVNRSRGAAVPIKAWLAGALGSLAFLLLSHYLAHDLTQPDDAALVSTLADVARAIAHHTTVAAPLPTILGLSYFHGILALVLVAALSISSMLPFFDAAIDSADRADAGSVGLYGGVGALLGIYVLLRFGVLMMPQLAHEASLPILAIGLLTMFAGAARALTHSDLRRIAASLAVVGGGACWVAASSVTPQGLQGALALVQSRAVVGMVILLCVEALISRTGKPALSSWGGVAKSAPRLSLVLALALLGSTLLPGGSGFWGALLALLGQVGRSPVWALAFFAALVVSLGAHLRLARLLSAPARPEWESAPELEAFGGKVPDLRSGRERGWALLLAAALLFLTLAPRVSFGLSNRILIDSLPALDAPGPTQVASNEPHARTSS